MIKKNIFNRIFINQCYFKIYDKIFFFNNPNSLIKNGYLIYDKKFTFENIDFDKYLDYSNYDFVMHRRKIEFQDLKKIYKNLYEIGIASLLKNYLGNKIFAYDNSILTLGNNVSNNDSMQPHHDSKSRRIKIYIWLNNKNLNTHPLYYLKKSHKKIKIWKNSQQTRFPYLNEEIFEKIYGEKGEIILFDTHGIHSHFKTTTVPRSVIELTFEPFGFFNRLNKKNIKGEIKRLNLIDLDQLILN